MEKLWEALIGHTIDSRYLHPIAQVHKRSSFGILIITNQRKPDKTTSGLKERREWPMQKKVRPIWMTLTHAIQSTLINVHEPLKHLKKFKQWFGDKNMRTAWLHKIRASILSWVRMKALRKCSSVIKQEVSLIGHQEDNCASVVKTNVPYIQWTSLIVDLIMTNWISNLSKATKYQNPNNTNLKATIRFF